MWLTARVPWLQYSVAFGISTTAIGVSMNKTILNAIRVPATIAMWLIRFKLPVSDQRAYEDPFRLG
jgi:hypothetical protein